MSSSPVTGQGSDRPGLVRAIGRWALTAAIVNGVIGSGIFGMPAEQASLTGAWSPLTALVAGLGVLAIVLCFAEVASRFRDPGGPYLYAREAFGPMMGYQAGWLTFWTRVTAVAANLNVFVDYLSKLLPAAGTPTGRDLTKCLIMAVITMVNLIGVRQASWTINLFTVAKLLPLLLLIVLGLPRVAADVLATQGPAQYDWARAVLLLMFAYGGFEAPLIPASEARDPRRDSGFALLTALAMIAAVYMLIQFVVVGIVPHVGATAPDGRPLDRAPIATAFGVLIGPAGVALASVAAMVSIYGYTTGSVLQGPRLLYSMAERGELPRAFARVHAGYRTPAVAILTYSVLALGLALYGSFAWNALLSATVRLFTYGLTCAAVPVFRRRMQEAPGFRIPLGGVVAPLGMAFCAGLLILWVASQRELRGVTVLGVVVGLGLLLGWDAGRRRKPAAADTRS